MIISVYDCLSAIRVLKRNKDAYTQTDFQAYFDSDECKFHLALILEITNLQYLITCLPYFMLYYTNNSN